MVAVFNKELLSWYLITLKLKETVEAGIQNSQQPYRYPMDRIPLGTTRRSSLETAAATVGFLANRDQGGQKQQQF